MIKIILMIKLIKMKFFCVFIGLYAMVLPDSNYASTVQHANNDYSYQRSDRRQQHDLTIKLWFNWTTYTKHGTYL